MNVTIDCLQYCNWSSGIFEQMAKGQLDAVHVTICYHEDFRETVSNMSQWHRLFEAHPERIVHGRTAAAGTLTPKSPRKAMLVGFQ